MFVESTGAVLSKITDSNNLRDTGNGAWEISPFVVFGLCGFTLYLAWMFTVYISPILAPENILQALGLGVPLPTAVDGAAAAGAAGAATGAAGGGLPAVAASADGTSLSPIRHLARFAQMSSLLLTMLIAWRVSDLLSRRRSVLFMLVTSLALNSFGLLALLLFSENPSAYSPVLANILPIAAAALMGISQGFMVLLWSSFLCLIGEHRILLFTAICVGCAALLTLLMAFLLPLAAVWITLSLAWLSMACFAFVHYSQPDMPKPLLVKAKASDKRFNIHIKSTVSVILYSMAIGFAVCFIASSNSGFLGVSAAAVAVIVASIIVALDTVRRQYITESLLNKLHMPVMIIGIAPMFFANQTIQILGCAGLLCFFMVIFIINLTALTEHVRIDHLNSIRVFGFGRAGNALGFLIGGLICYLAYYAPHSLLFGGSDEFNWTSAFLLVLLAIFVAGSSFIFEDHYPTTNTSKLAHRAGTAAREHNLPSSDLLTLSSYMLEQDDDSQPGGGGIWSKRIKALSAQYCLSPKETEVLFLLAKGRNAEYIQNELVVSRHTAKAHIYHIYQKTGVHSRQDLINLLENVEIAP